MSRILIIDDEPSICWACEQALEEEGHEVAAVATAEAALAAAPDFAPDVILLDFRLPGADGLSALRQLRAAGAKTPVILMTAFGSLDLAVQALGEGAFDYLPKPFDLDQAAQVVARALASRAPATATGPRPEPTWSQEIIGASRGMQEVFRQIALVAPLNVPVLITGESGVGKELVARAIHRYSGRDLGRFVPVCVPALNESVLESELFGHVRGAFTGADRARLGLLEQAHEGTAFFDEIGDVPLLQQVKLLRVLEDRQIVPVGGNDARPSAFRLIAATHQSLEQLVAAGRFREDLYYRLNVYRISIPPLRDRPEDIPLLAERFLSQVSAARPLSLGAETIAALQRRSWRGNVRELRSAIQHAAVVCRGGVVSPDCLPAELAPAAAAATNGMTKMLDWLQHWLHERIPQVQPGDPATALYEQFLNAFEPSVLEGALAACRGNRKAAADVLGLHRETLRKRLRKHGIEDGE